ncbi:hypothetical protein K504DRAFT_399569 [Pleomassaria siparia CBS 279.74]|uniref:DUF7703 domain-containing protein n=1 Tax=Pleomassaria siparia CBS 279.74 TaxID=1314801 RepID=A0A6G1KM68_9PLEO|nr:hypothetical protein K504DRAFT_399569 [Pleomassaria siparia CBS 279.74]
MGVAEDLKNDLPVAMTMSAFMGVAWYICVELNIRLFLSFLRKRSLYFWACCVGSWGVMTQPLCTVLADFEQLTNPYLALTLIYISWWMMVIPQSIVLYSRLHLVMSNPDHQKYVLYMIVFTTIFISLPTMGLGIAAQASRFPRLMSANQTWDRIQVSIFFVQETLISILYILDTRRVLANRSILGEDDKTIRTVMTHLIYTNLFVVFLDVSLLAMSYSPYFYVQGAYKPCVYGVKLRVEFSILNRLVQTVRGSSTRSYGRDTDVTGSRKKSSGRSAWNSHSNRNNVRMETYTPQSEANIMPPSERTSSTPSIERIPKPKDGTMNTTLISATSPDPKDVI